MLVGDIISSNARLYPNKIGIVDENVRLTWSQFNERVNRLANVLLGLGLSKGDRVAILSQNRHQYAEFFFAVAKAGLITVCLNYRLLPEQLLRILNDSQPRAIIIEEKRVADIETAAKEIALAIGIGQNHRCPFDYETSLMSASPAAPEVDLQENDLFRLNYTTGTTGTSKGVMLTHKNEIANCIIRQAGTANTRDDVVLNAAPLFAAGPQARFFGAAFLGCTSVIATFSVETFLKTVDREKITYASLLPTTLRMVREILSDNPGRYDLSSLHKFQTEGGQHCSANDLKTMLDYFHIGYDKACKPYGPTEAMSSTYLIPEDVAIGLDPNATAEQKRRLDSIGKPLFNNRVRVVDENDNDLPPGKIGEMIIKGDHVMKGYWRNPERTEKALRGGWYHSSDLAEADEEGFLYFRGRLDFVIKSGGFLVGPEEVEAVISEHPAVTEAAVIGLDDERWGQAVTAVVCLKENHIISPEDIKEHCRKRLASFQIPKTVFFAEKLPRDIAYSKIDRLELLRTYSGKS